MVRNERLSSNGDEARAPARRCAHRAVAIAATHVAKLRASPAVIHERVSWKLRIAAGQHAA
jgi:hypothetical protein